MEATELWVTWCNQCVLFSTADGKDKYARMQSMHLPFWTA